MTLEEKREYNRNYYNTHKEEKHNYYLSRKEELKDYYKLYNRNKYQMFAYVLPEEKELIENYELAKKNGFDGWCIHHRFETHTSEGERRLVQLTKKELIALDMYYSRPATELIFLRKDEHSKLHKGGSNEEGRV